jgi:hypothetical protein
VIPPFRPRHGNISTAESLAWIASLAVTLIFAALIFWFLFNLGWIWIIVLAAFLKWLPKSKR